jgi:hypothetical protein
MRRWPDDAAAYAPLTSRRHLGFATALLPVAAAGAYHWTAGDGEVAPAAAGPTASAATRLAAGGSGAQGTVQSGTSALMANPFSTFQQQVPLREPVPAAAPPQPAAAFAYVGRRIEAGRPVVVLSHQGRYVSVYGPGALDSEYEVEKLDERQVVLLYLPLMTRQVLSLPAPAPLQPGDADVLEEN